MNKKIIFSSGGTGGHLFPAVNLMKYFSKKEYKVLLVTDIRGKNLLKETSFDTYVINTDSPINKSFFRKILSLFKIFLSIIKSFTILKKEKPCLIFGFGGYVSFPISFVSKFLKIPLVIYENNLVLGRSNKSLIKISKKVLIGTAIPSNFPQKYKYKICEVGNILREEIANYSEIKKKNEDKVFTILVLGGSQGAEIFGKIIPDVLKKIKDKKHNIQIKQQCIGEQKEFLVDFYNKNNIHNNIFEFTNDILNLISSSDLAISRSGASTTAELVNTHTPFIAVPYPYSTDNHQFLNAKYYEEKGCCWLLKEDDFISENLFNLLLKIIGDKEKLKEIRENMKKNSSKNVYSNITNAVKEFI